ncbi:MAG: hypothetical protein K0R18_108 [Bacillales bacterium]|jgi:hypothetical protein|nr:hypothetical protein [Bacillales bacterium]
MFREKGDDILKRLIRKAEQLDVYNRDAAIAYINGQVFLADTHAQCVGLYLDEVDSDKDLDNYQNRPSDSQLEQVDVKRIAFAHLLEKAKGIDYKGLIVLQPGIYVESITLMNVTMDEVTNTIKQSYPQYDVFEIDGNITSKEDVKKLAGLLLNKKELIK